MAINEIHILHHTHVDVGYTDLQPVIFRTHVEYLEQALDLCRETDDYPDDARFRWISEFSWPVVEFLRRRPERSEELFARLREGRCELAGLFLDPTELMDRRAFEMSLLPALQLARQQGFAVTTAMTTDIPGQGWGLADILAEQGLKYLSVSPNAMVSKPLEVQRPFWWVGPRGKRVLVWFTDWRKGWYGEGHVLGFPQGFAEARDKVLEYLELLHSEGYPWQVLALHFGADNYPPATGLADLVRAWNEQGNLPRMRISTNAEFFGRLQELHGDGFPECQLAWPDWWSEGLGSAAYEAGLSRETHSRLLRIEALLSRLGESRDLWPIWENLLLFDEHTWGCSDMASEPHSFVSRASWAYKATHIYRAYDDARRLEAELAAAVAARQPTEEAADYRDATVREAGPAAASLVLANPLGVGWAGPVELPGLSPSHNSLQGPDGALAMVQRSVATPLAPARAWAMPRVAAGTAAVWAAVSADIEPRTQPAADPLVLQNDHYLLRWDESGRLVSLVDRDTETELIDPWSPWGFAEVIHETITGHQDRKAVWERGYTAIPYGKRRTDATFRREGSLAAARLLSRQDGVLFDAVVWQSALPTVPSLETEIRLWRGLRRIDVEVRLNKEPRTAYESLYCAFPVNLDHPRGFVHSGDAVFEVERQQLPGTCRDYYAVEHFAALQGDQGWSVLCPLDAPLVQMGQITFGQWADHLRLTRGCIYSWLCNNFWYTNFPGYQQGRLSFRFVLQVGAGELDLSAAEHFARQVRMGLTVA